MKTLAVSVPLICFRSIGGCRFKGDYRRQEQRSSRDIAWPGRQKRHDAAFPRRDLPELWLVLPLL
jgi:hypothetical protein